MDGFDFNFRWRYSESKQSLEYDDRSNALSILSRFADYLEIGIWGRVVVFFMVLLRESD